MPWMPEAGSEPDRVIPASTNARPPVLAQRIVPIGAADDAKREARISGVLARPLVDEQGTIDRARVLELLEERRHELLLEKLHEVLELDRGNLEVIRSIRVLESYLRGRLCA